MSDKRKKIHPHKFTLWVAIGSIIMMFAGLTSAYIVKRDAPDWASSIVAQDFLVFHCCDPAQQPHHANGREVFEERTMCKYRTNDFGDGFAGNCVYRFADFGISES